MTDRVAEAKARAAARSLVLTCEICGTTEGVATYVDKRFFDYPGVKTKVDVPHNYCEACRKGR